MNKCLLAISTASFLALTACGGGDNGVQVNSPTNPNNSANNSSNNPNKPISNSDEFTLAQIATWNGLIDEGVVQFKSKTAVGKNNSTEKFNKLTVAGKEIEIIPPEYDTYNLDSGYIRYDNMSTADKDKYFVDVGMTAGTNPNSTGTAYARYGIVEDKVNKTVSVFYQGVPTKDMPTTGTAEYKGHSIAYQPYEKIRYYGDAQFNVDFANKQITGNIQYIYSPKNPATLSIDSKITGTTFKGTNYQGQFYGPNAQNIAGSFVDKERKIQGVFGANKQPK